MSDASTPPNPFGPFTLTSHRLAIRPLANADLDKVHAILNESFGESPLSERQDWLDWTVRNYTALGRLYQPPYGDRAIVLQHDQTLVGTVGLVPSFGPFDTLPYFHQQSTQPPSGLSTPEIGLFWALGETYRGRGYATEAARTLIDFAFTHLSLKRIVATTTYDNHASMAVMKRLHMIIEHNPHPTPPWFQVVGILENPAQHLQR